MSRDAISVAMVPITSLILVPLWLVGMLLANLPHTYIFNPFLGILLNLNIINPIDTWVGCTSALLSGLHDKPIWSNPYHWITCIITLPIIMIISYYLIKSFTWFHAKIAGTKTKNFKLVLSTCLTLGFVSWMLFLLLSGRHIETMSLFYAEAIIQMLLALMVFVYNQRKLKNALIAQLDRATLF